jgi:hypothetical protein
MQDVIIRLSDYMCISLYTLVILRRMVNDIQGNRGHLSMAYLQLWNHQTVDIRP